MEVVCGVRMGMAVDSVGTRGEVLVSNGESVSVADGGGARWKGFPESSAKTSHIVSHSRSISAMSFCRLAWKEEMIKVIDALIDQCVGRSVGGCKGLNGPRTGSLQWG